MDKDGMPWWVKAVAFVGLPSVLACYLVYSLVTGILSGFVAMQAQMNNLTLAVTNVNATLSVVIADHGAMKVQNERILGVLQATCANAAKDRGERETCFAR